MNLLKETIRDIECSNHNIKDIVFIGSQVSGHFCTWEEFIELADKEYDDGYGAQHVAKDLIIVFNDGFQMWRNEYDGSEWWEFQKSFSMPLELKPIKKILGDDVMWSSLSEINES